MGFLAQRLRGQYGNGTDVIPAVDWDLAEIYYATSKDGFDWVERGKSVGPEEASYGDRTVSTPDILVYRNKYYLYYQAFTGAFRQETGDYCDVTMAWADCPDGPWHPIQRPVLEHGDAGDWDEASIHDPYPLVYQGKIWLFYKGAPLGKGSGASFRRNKTLNQMIRAQGVAIADSPEGLFQKLHCNPVLNSGHETCLFPYREGIAALVSIDGPEKNTVQFASDGKNFQLKSIVQLPPLAPGPFCPDAFADNGDGRGISWGLAHIERACNVNHSYILRFDCDLHRDMRRQSFRQDNLRPNEESFLQAKVNLGCDMKREIVKQQNSMDIDTI